MDTYEGPSEEELYRMEKLKKNTLYGSAGRPNNLMATDGEFKQWQKDIMERNSIMSKEEIQTFLKPKNDPVNHPSHYTDGKIEVIDFIEDKKLGFHLGNAVKYISRAGKKDPNKEIEDLEKAIWYIQRKIDQLKKLKEEVLTYRGYPVNPCGREVLDHATTVSCKAGDTDGDEITLH